MNINIAPRPFAPALAKSATTSAVGVPGVELVSQGVNTLAAGSVYYEPFLAEATIPLNYAQIEVSGTAPTSGSTARLAIHSADKYWQPTALLSDLGTVAIDAVGVVSKSFTLSLPPGRYLASIKPGATVDIRNMRGGSRLLGVSSVGGINGFIYRLYATESYGAFADPPTVWTSVTNNNIQFQHNILMRWD